MTHYCLDSKWALLIKNRRGYIERRADHVRVAALSALEAVVIGLMNGRRTNQTLEELMFEIVGHTGVKALKQVINRFKPILVQGLSIRQNASLDELAAVLPPDPSEGFRPLPGPRVLHWWVTDYCPRKCVYCFANPKSGAKATDATLSRDTLQRIFTESASLGTTDLLVAGGEPFLRKDLPEILGDAIEQGISPSITTKYPLNSTLVEKLVNAGLRHICISVDSFSPDDNAILIGSKNYVAQVYTSVKNLIKAGMAFSFECVVTRLNVHAMEDVIAEAERLGAQVVQVVPYESVLRTIGSYQNNQLMLPHNYPLDEYLQRLSTKYPNVKVERFEKQTEGDEVGYHCDIGITKLLFGPEGKIHRCYKLLRDRQLSGPDLNHVSVAEAWHDPGVAKIMNPPRDAYSDFLCASCERFNKCNQSGRCIYHSYVHHRSYYAMDRNCRGPYILQNVQVSH
jgi:MoaA/NifB/PqqE/SkfB family radical SAM enzyme